MCSVQTVCVCVCVCVYVKSALSGLVRKSRRGLLLQVIDQWVKPADTRGLESCGDGYLPGARRIGSCKEKVNGEIFVVVSEQRVQWNRENLVLSCFWKTKSDYFVRTPTPHEDRLPR